MRATLIKILSGLTLAAVILSALCVTLAFHAGGDGVRTAVLAITGCAVVVAAVIAAGVYLLHRVVKTPDPDGDSPEYSEYAPLLRRIGEQKSLLRQSRAALEDKERQLSAITESMSEGLALLDASGNLVYLNRAAAALLGVAPEEAVGRHIVAVSENNILQAAVHTAMGGSRCRESIELGGVPIAALTSPVVVEGAVRGVVLMLIDQTERRSGEDMRREFSANVSHELKTPITSISGYAELIAGGMVKSEDVPTLSRRIYREARRLIALIDDIMRLSRLDEGEISGPMEEVELSSAAHTVCERLESKAEEGGVELIEELERAACIGDAQLMDELISNLVDNSIKYNSSGGHVWVTTGTSGGVPFVSVRDDGIGIAPEHMERIFERFYRVDRSRSKETGGTGLGLSIVKHAAAYMRAEVSAESVPDKGTEIRVLFNGKGGV